MKLQKSLILTALLFASSISQAAVLYDIDFSAPLNSAGQPITIDSSINTPSGVTFGSIEMQEAFAGADANWAVFNTSCDSSEQLFLDLPANSQSIYLSLSIYAKDLVDSDNSFRIHVDSEAYGARSISMHAGLDLWRFFNEGFSTSLGEINDDTVYQLSIHADSNSNTYSATLNGSEVLSTSFGSDSYITKIRIGLSQWTGTPSNCANSNIGITNIKVYESPEDLLPPVVEEVETGSNSPLLLSFLFLLTTLRRPFKRKV
jgi:hypothetical protein